MGGRTGAGDMRAPDLTPGPLSWKERGKLCFSLPVGAGLGVRLANATTRIEIGMMCVRSAAGERGQEKGCDGYE